MIPYIDTHDFDRFYCALVLPYKPNSLLPDLDTYRQLVRYFAMDERFLEARGALIVNPEAGEIFYMTRDERAATIEVALEERPRGMPVFAGAFGLRRDEVIDSALHAKSLGVDGIFVMAPAGTMEVSTNIDGAKNPEIWTDHVRAVAEATELPLIIHPSHPFTQEWGGGVPLETVKSVLNNVPSVVGWKMLYAEQGHFRIAAYLRSLARHVAILNLPDLGVHDALMRDLVDGAVSGSYNFMKEPEIEHLLAWRRGDITEVTRIFTRQIVPIQEVIYGDLSRLHIRYKLAAWIRGLVAHPFMRPPMPPPRADEAEAVYRVLQQAGLSVITRQEFANTLTCRDEILTDESLSRTAV